MNDFLEQVRALVRGEQLFSRGAPIFVARAPGRLDLMGGNDDYTGGMVFEATIREATWAAVQRRRDQRIVLVNPQMSEHGWQPQVECELTELTSEAAVRAIVNRSPQVRWTAYVLGLFYLLRERYGDQARHGATVYIASDVPVAKGVSSSAALEVAVMKAAVAAYGITLDGVELAEACQWAENVIAESACGIMDQITVVLGDEGHVLPLVCQPCVPQPLVRLPEALTCWAIDSGVSHAVTGHEYEAARAAAFMGYKLICDSAGLSIRADKASLIPRFTDDRWGGYLANLAPSQFRAQFEAQLPEAMTGQEYLQLAGTHVDPFTKVRDDASYAVRACTRYAVEENLRVTMFAELARGRKRARRAAGRTTDGRADVPVAPRVHRDRPEQRSHGPACRAGTRGRSAARHLRREGHRWRRWWHGGCFGPHRGLRPRLSGSSAATQKRGAASRTFSAAGSAGADRFGP